MQVTAMTWAIAVAGFAIMGVLWAAQLVAFLRPRAGWTIENIYGGRPEETDPKAYFAFNRGYSIADVFFWGPLQFAASTGMLLGQRWGFLLGLMASVPFWYTAVTIFVWDRDLGFRRDTLFYWVVIWGIFPAYGVVAGVYCFWRLLF
ncbi:MAG: hypothetical protein QNI99_05400 [Woeseiaceae bacterium]|nr:hypothetical protein [Woeseiaceae bacterium]